MIDEEMQRTMQFILEQQAQLTVKLDRLTERVDKLSEKVDKLTDAQARHEARTGQLRRVIPHIGPTGNAGG